MKSIRFIVFTRFLIVGLVFLVVLAGLAYLIGHRMISRFYIQDNLRIIQSLAKNIQTQYLMQLEAVDRLAKTPGIAKNFNMTQAKTAIQAFWNIDVALDTIYIYQKDGTLLLSMRRNSDNTEQPHRNFYEKSEKDFIKLAEAVFKERKSQISEVYTASTGASYQVYLSPLEYGLVSGGLFADNKTMLGLLDGLQLSEKNFIVMSDTKGNVIYHQGVGTAASPAFNEILEKAAKLHTVNSDTRRQFFEVPDDILLAGRGFYIFPVYLPEIKRVVILGASKDRISAKEKEFLGTLFVVFPIGFLFCVLMSYLIGNKISTPLHEVILAIKKLNEGDTSHRIQSLGKNEISYLCDEVNLLTERIEKNRIIGELWDSNSERQAPSQPQ
jgi:hypothetical protein